MRGIGVFSPLAAGLWLVAAAAHAEPTDQDRALAATLFDQGHSLLERGEVAEACRKLEESRRLDPLPGTILNLAACHEREGLTASAMAEFREARALAERDHRDDRVAFAGEHLRALEPRLSVLVVLVPPEADVPGLAVLRDGVAIGRAAWGTRIPVDPGPHVVDVSAPGKVLRHVEVQVKPEGDTETVTIAALEDAPPPGPAPAPPVASVPAPPPPEAVPAPPPPRHGLSSRRVWALFSAGVGVVGAGAGTALGVVAIQKHHDPAAVCASDPCPTATSLNNDARGAADAST
ncbi:MAG: hypothetical protein ACRELB_10925, partial [Polyangiaceae bacterium]